MRSNQSVWSIYTNLFLNSHFIHGRRSSAAMTYNGMSSEHIWLGQDEYLTYSSSEFLL